MPFRYTQPLDKKDRRGMKVVGWMLALSAALNLLYIAGKWWEYHHLGIAP